jgi:acyl-CoA synthetase (NDP forming)
MTVSQQDRGIVDRFRPLFEPRTIAVVGASASNVTLGNEMINQVRRFGFTGPIYPIHPSADEIEGLPAYRTLGDTPEPVDYAYVAVGAATVPGLLRAANGRVKFAQVSSSGFGETLAGRELESELVAAAREGGVRLLGPNCLGTYSPRGHITFIGGASDVPGGVGVVTQSGGLGTDTIRRGNERGVRFRGLVTVGNSADIGPSDILEFYLADPDTHVIGLYLEDVKDGRRFFEILRTSCGRKPVVLLRGGRSEQGQRAAASHTGALASDNRVWQALSKQTGVVLTRTLDQFVDTLLAFQALKPRADHPTERVVLFGNGGGASVLASDSFSEAGLSVPPFSEETRKPLEALDLPAGSSINNPIDTPRSTLRREEGRIVERILEAVYAGGSPDALVMHLNVAAFIGSADQRLNVLEKLIEIALEVQSRNAGRTHFALVLRSDGGAQAEERKRVDRGRALALGIPVFDEIPAVAEAMASVSRYERFLASRGGAPA